MRYCFLVTSVLALLLLNVAGAIPMIGIASIRAPAVIVTNNTGAMTTINLTVTNGNGIVSVVGPTEVGNSTVQSAYTAARYATNYLGFNFKSYNFTYSISDASENVSGPSAGAAMTMLAISALSHKQLRQDFTMTGTISSDGSIGEVGGVYDKVSAASTAGIKLILVPSMPAGSQEDALYLLAQANFGIPLVQVSNISGAAHYAFNKSISGIANGTSYNFYTNYSVNELPDATLACSNHCNTSEFGQLVNSTLNFTSEQIMNLSADPSFSGIAAQLGSVLNESKAVVQHNYLYTGADLAFLDYINAFYFSNHETNISSGLQVLLSTQRYCSSLVQPSMTSSNYEYVLSAELRRSWANYTINTTIAEYNQTSIDTDGVLGSIYSAAQADGWCRAAGTIYASQQAGNASEYVQPSQALGAVALSRINRAKAYGLGMYFDSAQLAYNQGNYPLAIIDADYAYVLSGASAGTGNMTNSEITGAAGSLLTANATYGVWATEFAKEALFYINESRLTSNSTLAHTFALQAYSSAALAQSIGSDTLLIYRNLVPSVTAQSVNINAVLSSISTLDSMLLVLLVLLVLVVMLIAINVVLVALLLKKRRHARHAGRGRTRHH
jgi:predicted S18 family serine protease